MCGTKRTVGTITKTISNTYNLDGSVATKTYPATAGGSGNVITYTYSNAQRLTALENNVIHVHYATTITYAPHGAISSMLENPVSGGFAGITYTRSYNNRLQLTANSATSSNGTALNMAYGYDQGGGVNNGNLVNLTNNRDTNRSVSYTYDVLNRVATAQTSGSMGSFCWGQSFGYDRYANLTSVSVTKCSAPMLNAPADTNNHITGGSFGYDASGNMTNDGSHSYTFDAENRPATGAGVTYTYDGDDWRTKKSSGQLEWHDIDSGNLLDEFDSGGNLQAEFYYIGSLLFASRSFYYFGDNVNSIRILTDVNGNVTQETDYYAFGGELDVTPNSNSNRKFTSKKRDSETGLDYSHHRLYNPPLGRWNTVDPAEGDPQLPQTLNAYGYVRNNPVNHKDMSGAFEDDDDRPDKNDARGSGPFCGAYAEVSTPFLVQCNCIITPGLEGVQVQGSGCFYVCFCPSEGEFGVALLPPNIHNGVFCLFVPCPAWAKVEKPRGASGAFAILQLGPPGWCTGHPGGGHGGGPGGTATAANVRLHQRAMKRRHARHFRRRRHGIQ